MEALMQPREKRGILGFRTNVLNDDVVFRQNAQLETKLKTQENEKKQLVTQIQDLTNKCSIRKCFCKKKKKNVSNSNKNGNFIATYMYMFIYLVSLKCNELEKEKKEQVDVFENERNALKAQLTDLEEEMMQCTTDLKSTKTTNAQMQEQISRQVKKYNELVNVLSTVSHLFLFFFFYTNIYTYIL
ncbi:hypothetical protein RFI_12356, partial [Reticulomyxa filosa]